MKIDRATVQLSAQHHYSYSEATSKELEIWGDEQKSRARLSEQTNLRTNNIDTVTIHSEPEAVTSRATSKNEKINSTASAKGISEEISDPKLNVLKQILESLTGRKIHLFRPNEGQAAEPTPENNQKAAPPTETPIDDWGFVYREVHTVDESETTRFHASGTIVTQDGREIDISLDLEMAREFHEKLQIEVRAGSAEKVDPLIINLSNGAASVSANKFEFDMNMDGEKEEIAGIGPGSAFLVWDKNSDGRINDGSELFGPASDNGFGELAALDEDQNGFIDENDTAFQHIGIWQPGNNDSGPVKSLQTVGIGAIMVNGTETAFEIKQKIDTPLAQIRETGIFLFENGRAGTIQELDFYI
ncbi:hypothetical protein QUF70_09905 [Desulfobacterales bacterium HSG17]|nr:hypothetical protein [Desulfobacterales bacterium HSG17]